MNQRTGFDLIAILGISLSITLAGCNEGPPIPAPEKVEQKANVPLEITKENALRLVSSEHEYVDNYEMACLQNDFKEYFKKGTVSNPIDLPLKPLKFTLGSLNAALQAHDMDKCDPGQYEEVGVIVHYGLDTNDNFDIALEFTCMKLENFSAGKAEYSYSNGATYYVIENNALVDKSASISVWQNTEGGKFGSKVLIERTPGAAFVKFLNGHDVSSVVFPYWNELKPWLEQNGMTDPAHLIEIVPIAGPSERIKHGSTYAEYDYRMGVSWMPNIPLTTTPHAGSVFKEKAADLGAPCPPNCLSYAVFKTHGVAPRSSCP